MKPTVRINIEERKVNRVSFFVLVPGKQKKVVELWFYNTYTLLSLSLSRSLFYFWVLTSVTMCDSEKSAQTLPTEIVEIHRYVYPNITPHWCQHNLARALLTDMTRLMRKSIPSQTSCLRQREKNPRDYFDLFVYIYIYK